ncbi:DUF445 domain-containing protein [Paenibacillus allorhizosphaerae]|uniref:DUF445 domain-containing protein n=1 Tax=Paenibacillus allorhizosphaerae TaxID=2849866 RepID=A0ABN7TPC7_9BACL|nr:DUF445 domain-containing protein [Paenibacillus allorhizosphaerae]CAG7649840.1 hypothetical protein PAECIP111802_04569 [Paenibacillus allorhizosphaerae]
MAGKARYTAAVSLGVMGAGFVATMPFLDIPWVRFMQSGFEAGLVGGLADWFAVTALFRHPLGIPIPHTALLPRNRQKVTNALVKTVEEDLLSKESIHSKLEQFRIAERLVDGAMRQIGTEQFKAGIRNAAEKLLESIPKEKAAVLLEREIRKRLDHLDAKQVLDTVVGLVYEHKYDEKAFDFVLDLAEQWTLTAETRLRLGAMAGQAMSRMQTNGFMQLAVNAFLGFYSEDKLGGMIQQFLLSALYDLKRTGDSNRVALLKAVRERIDGLTQDPKTEETLEQWKQRLLSEWNLAELSSNWVEQLHSRLLGWVREPDFAEHYIIPLLEQAARRVRGDEELMAKLEHWIHEQLNRWIEANHSKIGGLIRENIDRFDNETLIKLMEDKIGGDLQWIRVNGALCGFLIGIVLEGLKAAV